MARVVAGGRGLNMLTLGEERTDEVFGTTELITFRFGFRDFLRIAGEYSYDAQGRLIGGTVDSVTRVDEEGLLWRTTGIDVDLTAPQIVEGLFQEDLSPLIEAVLAGDDVLVGGAGQDVLLGFDGNDRIMGGGEADTLIGGDGDDRLSGGEGRDALVGGGGLDVMSGGAGVDFFVFGAASDSTAAARDRISDFSAGDGDKIVLSSIDAVRTAGGDQPNEAFTLVERFGKTAGELTVTALRQANAFLVQGDVDGDGRGDFVLMVVTTDGVPPSAGDFLL